MKQKRVQEIGFTPLQVEVYSVAHLAETKINFATCMIHVTNISTRSDVYISFDSRFLLLFFYKDTGYFKGLSTIWSKAF